MLLQDIVEEDDDASSDDAMRDDDDEGLKARHEGHEGLKAAVKDTNKLEQRGAAMT